MENIILNVSVKLDGYFGDWKTAIDETYELSKKLNIICSLNYANSISFKIHPKMTQEDIDILKATEVVVAL